MKHILITLLIVLTATYGGNKKKNQQQGAAEDATLPQTEEVAVNEEVPPEQVVDPLASLYAAAPENLMDEVVRQLPPEYIPEPNEDGEDGITQLLNSKVKPYSIYWAETYGECDSFDIRIMGYPRLDGSWLVSYISGGGCDTYTQGDPEAFLFKDGKLTPCEWPFELPGLDDFIGDGLLSWLDGGDDLEHFRAYGGIHYDYDEFRDNVISMWFLDDSYYDFSVGTRTLWYHWDGTRFNREDGGFALIDEPAFSRFVLEEPLPGDVPEGYALERDGNCSNLVKDGEKVARFMLGPGGKVQQMDVYAPQYCARDRFMHAGMLLAEINERWPGLLPGDRPAMLRSDGQVLVILNTTGENIAVNRKDIVGEPGPDGVFTEWSFAPGARVQSVVVGLLEKEFENYLSHI